MLICFCLNAKASTFGLPLPSFMEQLGSHPCTPSSWRNRKKIKFKIKIKKNRKQSKEEKEQLKGHWRINEKKRQVLRGQNLGEAGQHSGSQPAVPFSFRHFQILYSLQDIEHPCKTLGKPEVQWKERNNECSVSHSSEHSFKMCSNF